VSAGTRKGYPQAETLADFISSEGAATHGRGFPLLGMKGPAWLWNGSLKAATGLAALQEPSRKRTGRAIHRDSRLGVRQPHAAFRWTATVCYHGPRDNV